MRWPLHTGDLDELAYRKLVAEFNAAADRAGCGWVKQFVYPSWLMRKFIEENP